jgi:uncharacterized protein (DUF302 family)
MATCWLHAAYLAWLASRSSVPPHAIGQRKGKLGGDFRPYVILGACDPSLAHRALTLERDAGILLPCNVVYATDDPARSVGEVMDPVTTLHRADNSALESMAREARLCLERVLDGLSLSARTA